MTIYIKNMVCVRCKTAVQVVLEKLEIDYAQIEIGKVTLSKGLSQQQQKKLNGALEYNELELMDNKKNTLLSV